MKSEEQYESWKRHRAKVEAPNDFADRVMESVHHAQRLTTYLFLQSLAAATGRSRFIRAGVCSVALAVWMMRIGSILAIFVPR
jgi:hypothetical protein